MSITQERILDAAELLFAEQGVSATSLRSITTRAGVNAAAIHYHFGSKPELVSAIVARRIAPLSRDRLARLERLEQRFGEHPIPVEQLIECFVAPRDLVGDELRDELHRLGILAAWLRVEGEGDWKRFARPTTALNERYARALCRGRGLPLDEARERFRFVIGSVVELLRQQTAGRPVLTQVADPTAEGRALRARVSRLVGFLAAGLAAPATLPAGPASDPHATPMAAEVSESRIPGGPLIAARPAGSEISEEASAAGGEGHFA